MGLDITSYSKVGLLQGESDNIDCLWEWMDNFKGDIVLHPNRSFPIQSEGLVKGVYTYENICDVDFSCSYSGWSTIRDKLAKACGYNKATVADIALTNPEILTDTYWKSSAEARPYQQAAFNQDGITRLNLLLNFSDCEGIINTTCCKIIAEDLAWLEENKTLDEDLGKVVSDLRDMFEFAGYHEGVVVFH